MKKYNRIKRIISLALAAVLALFTLYVALDTFVIPRAYAQVEPVSQSAAQSADAETAETTEPGTPSETTTEQTTTAYIEPKITDTTSSIATDNGAVLAVNGDFYGSQERGYVIRNGVLYRAEGKSDQEDLVIYEDGTFEIVNEDEVPAEELLENGAWQVLSFGPGIVSDGEIAISENEEVDKAMRSNPRTAIGFIDENHYVLVVSDGRTDESEGLSLYELAEFMQSLGVTTGYNLDGGGSSTMYFNGNIINNPTSSGRNIKERSVSDIIYF